ncbi:MAG: glycoside hydrolase family 140 protein [Gemmatimonadetes bacterium]|nr:glycoside hydrolase family 140 protein [Gemmatimonadota bacterium]
MQARAGSPTAPLRVSTDGRWLTHTDGRPFFYLGDTAWELFHRLNREEADLYLRDRAGKGFTVIQAVALAELNGLNVPSPYGHTPLIGNDPTRPHEDYFRHVDYIVDRAEELGIFIGMLPTWGDKFNRKWGVGPEVFTPENARVYGQWLGNRYRDEPIIWILGGDRSPESEQHLAIIRAMAEGIRAAVGDRQLITYHPQGEAASYRWFHDDPWLSFNMFQSGHGRRDAANDRMVEEGYRLAPVKPVLDGEPRYEDHPVNWRPESGWFDEFDVRQAAYWAMLAGAAGHTYGDHNIWQMWQPGREPISSARTPWRDALSHIGSTQVGYMRRLFESRPYQRLVPDQTIVTGSLGEGPSHLRAARASDGSFLFVYTPYGGPVQVDMAKIAGASVAASWFDPRTGTARSIGSFANRGSQSFDPPGQEARGNDWVLVLDDHARRFGTPGSR